MMFLELITDDTKNGICYMCGKKNGEGGHMLLTSPNHDTYDHLFCPECYPKASHFIGVALGQLYAAGRG